MQLNTHMHTLIHISYIDMCNRIRCDKFEIENNVKFINSITQKIELF